MGYNEELAHRVRIALEDIPHVEEKKMFRGVTFMVNGKMCVSVSGDELMCRIDGPKCASALEKNGCRGMVRGGRTLKGFVFVDENVVRNKKQFEYWIKLCLEFNGKAKASKKKIKPHT